MAFTPAVPIFEYMFRALAAVAASRELGQTPLGQLRIIDITGGGVEEEVPFGTILPGGADWQIVNDFLTGAAG